MEGSVGNLLNKMMPPIRLPSPKEIAQLDQLEERKPEPELPEPPGDVFDILATWTAPTTSRRHRRQKSRNGVVGRTDALQLQRARATTMWMDILESCGESSGLFAKVLAETAQEGFPFVEELRRSLQDVLETKSAATLSKRASVVACFQRWAIVTDGRHSFPPREPEVYKYLTHLEEHKAAPTKAASFPEAVNLAGELLEFKTDAIQSSLRIKGSAKKGSKRKRMTKKARPLKAMELKAFEVGVSRAGNAVDQYFCGVVCDMVHRRLR